MSTVEPKRTAYLRDELRNILTALHVTMQSTANGTDQKVEETYQKGFTDALLSVSLALGLTFEKDASVPVRHRSAQRSWITYEQAQIEEAP